MLVVYFVHVFSAKLSEGMQQIELHSSMSAFLLERAQTMALQDSELTPSMLYKSPGIFFRNF